MKALCTLCLLTLGACSQSDLPTKKLMDAEADDRPLVFPKPGYLLDSVYEDLSDDALTAPDQPVLSISASPGALTLTWERVEQQQSATLFRYDSLTGIEQQIHHFTDTQTSTMVLDSLTHLTAWHRQQFRIELCTAQDCVSSRRVATTDLASHSLSALRPGVFVEGERYAQAFAMNHDASLLVTTLPVEGSLDLYFRVANSWTSADRIRLPSLPLSKTRQLAVALSASGDTIALLSTDDEASATSDSANTAENSATSEAADTNRINALIILERLGESWVETANLPLADLHDAGYINGVSISGSLPQVQFNNPDSDEHEVASSVSMSADGEKVLLNTSATVTIVEQLPTQWSMTASWQPMSDADALLSVAANADLTRLHALGRVNQQLVMRSWQAKGGEPGTGQWRDTGSHEINGVSAYRNVQMAVDETGDTVGIAGWEDTDTAFHTPVFWRYSIASQDASDSETVSTQIMATDSLRQAPTSHIDATVTLTADTTLNTIALAWQGAYDKVSQQFNDAALTTYLYNDIERRWHPALELPEAIPTLAKQAFAQRLMLSGDAGTMVMSGTKASQSASGHRVGEILVLR